jgi:hypothetical protein
MPACHDNFLPREKRGGIFPELRWSTGRMMRRVRNIGTSVTHLTLVRGSGSRSVVEVAVLGTILVSAAAIWFGDLTPADTRWEASASDMREVRPPSFRLALAPITDSAQAALAGLRRARWSPEWSTTQKSMVGAWLWAAVS